MEAMLQSRPLIARVDRPVSSLALGTAFFRREDRTACFALLDAFREHGGTLVDSGRSYGDSEAMIGAWLYSRQARADMLLLTKCLHGKRAILPSEDMEEIVTKEIGESLSNLRTDHIDLYLLHRDNPIVSVKRLVERLNREVEQGRVRALGASNWTTARVDDANVYARARGLAGFDVLSNNLSLAFPTEPFYPRLLSVDAEAERWHLRTGTPLLSWSSQARGFFTGRFAILPSSGATDAFTARMAQVYGTVDNLERLRRAQTLGEQLGGYSAMQVALAWLLHKPFPVIPIVGPRTPEELASCVEATTIRLSPTQCGWLNLDAETPQG